MKVVSQKKISPVAFAALLLCCGATSASLAAPISIDWMSVGNPGNAVDPATGNQYGTVADDFRIMKFEWTNSQYVSFLNAIDPEGSNPNSVYNANMATNARGGITNTGTSNGSRYATMTDMGDKPVNFVSWFDAARVANWLHNGAQSYGSSDATASAPQNTGAYSLGTATSGNAPARNSSALFYLPTQDQWYKAAYYNPTLNGGAGGYTTYGNGFSSAPTPVGATLIGSGSAGPTGNFANYLSGAEWNGQIGNVTTVGTNGSSSFYGTFDMSGNLWEWNDLDGTGGSSIGVRGGDFGTTLVNISSSGGNSASSTSVETASNGFRLVAVPEPSTYVMTLAGLACGGYFMSRRRERP